MSSSPKQFTSLTSLMAGSLAQSGLAPELVRLVSDAVFKSDESGYGVVAMRSTCANWRTALKSSEPCWRKWTEWRYPLLSANIGFLGDSRNYFKVYCTQLKAESPPRPRRSKNEAYSINVLLKYKVKGAAVKARPRPASRCRPDAARTC